MKLLISFIKRRWYILILIGVLVLTLVFRYLTPTTSLPSTTEFNTWNRIEPGRSDVETIIAAMGAPLQISQVGDAQKYEYSSVFARHPNVVVVENNRAQVIERFISASESGTFVELKNTLGKPTALRYSEEWGTTYQMETYPTQGIAIIGNETAVFSIWYFKPMSQEEFDTTIGSKLMQTPTTAHPFGLEE